MLNENTSILKFHDLEINLIQNSWDLKSTEKGLRLDSSQRLWEGWLTLGKITEFRDSSEELKVTCLLYSRIDNV